MNPSLVPITICSLFLRKERWIIPFLFTFGIEIDVNFSPDSTFQTLTNPLSEDEINFDPSGEKAIPVAYIHLTLPTMY